MLVLFTLGLATIVLGIAGWGVYSANNFRIPTL
jgi:hypothetical protein